MGEASQQILAPFIKMIRPEVRDIWAYYEAGFHNLLVAAVEGRYSKEPIKTALGLFGEGQLGLSKVIILVEPSVNARRFSSVLQAIRNNFNPHDDFLLISRAPLDTLDFTSFKMHLGSKMIIDATGRSGAIPTAAPRPDPGRLAPGVRKWRLLDDTMLVVQVERDGRNVVEALVAARALAGLPMVVAVSPDIDIDDDVNLLWGIFTRFDPARDIVFTRTWLEGIKPMYEGIMGIDATFKKGYPEPLVMDDAIVKRVDQRWKSYGI